LKKDIAEKQMTDRQMTIDNSFFYHYVYIPTLFASLLISLVLILREKTVRIRNIKSPFIFVSGLKRYLRKTE